MSDPIEQDTPVFTSIASTIEEIGELMRNGISEETLLECLTTSIFNSGGGYNESQANKILAWAKRNNNPHIVETNKRANEQARKEKLGII